MPISDTPNHVSPDRCRSCEIPSGVNTGQKIQRLDDYLRNWRYNSIHHLSIFPPSSSLNSGTGKIYPIFHYPDRLDSIQRKIGFCLGSYGSPTAAAWTWKWREDFTTGSPTLFWGGTAGSATSLSTTGNLTDTRQEVSTYFPPSGTGTSAFQAGEIEITNRYPAFVMATHLPDQYEASAQTPVNFSDMAPGRIINTTDLGELAYRIGDGSIDVESVERLTRRTFFSHAHPTGTVVSGSGWFNVFNKFKFAARSRDLTGSGAEKIAYPAAVITATGHTGGGDVRIKFSSTASAASTWTYVVAAGDPTTPFLVTGFDGASPYGCKVRSTADDAITVEGYTDGTTTLTVHSVALFEGPAW